jgi:hypothetical protein
MALQEIAIREFWRGFLREEEAIYGGAEFGAGLKELIERVHPDLECDIGPVEGGRRKIVISAGGIREAFPAVEALAEGAPKLRRWDVVRYRQRRALRGKFAIGGLTLSPDMIRCEISSGGPGAGIVLYMPGYTHAEHSRYLALALLLLDTLLGEYDVEMKLGTIGIEPSGKENSLRALTLDRLPGVFDGYADESRN